MLNKLFEKNHNYANVFDKLKAKILSLYCFYDYKLKFVERADKNALFKNRIYFILDYKFE